ncbi:class I SAM-dependent methyltransferase [Ammoniphilus sp. YIM 78166]|uniref:class I SAM-dependent methyltransferase n=1 Tax=Ammoniphilus sp. YIM 78166 TaxID=1644106 RepID=UPI00106FB8A6|nr:class I SAM-dependent methyltransferase [Ammoniphilus sp. YIM 78166]
MMVVTTAQKENEELIHQAIHWAHLTNGRVVSRRGRSIEAIYHEEATEECLVVTQERILWYVKGTKQPFFFHPGMSSVRIKRLLAGDNDIMIQMCQIQPGDSWLDCTMGLGSDSIVASYRVGPKGKVVGVESESTVALLVREGLKTVAEYQELDEAARRVEVVCKEHEVFLKELPDKCFDVVYFDPMFRAGIQESDALKVLRHYANPAAISQEAIKQARRVARRRIVLKERKSSGEFERLGFKVERKESKEVAYGILDLEGDGA